MMVVLTFNIPAGDYDFETDEPLLNVENIEYAVAI